MIIILIKFYLDIHTQSNLAEVEIVSLVQELIPRYRLRADTDFACSNEDFIQTPRIDGSEFEPLTNPQIRALLDYYGKKQKSILFCFLLLLFPLKKKKTIPCF
jgi:trafficking kinesin-binding protein 1